MGARFAMVRQQVGRAFTLQGMGKILRRPDRVVRFLWASLWDIKYRKTTAQAQLAILGNSVAALSVTCSPKLPSV
jgi:hypothetical protein